MALTAPGAATARPPFRPKRKAARPARYYDGVSSGNDLLPELRAQQHTPPVGVHTAVQHCTTPELTIGSMLHTQAQEPVLYNAWIVQRHEPQPRRSLRHSRSSWRTAEESTAPSRAAAQTPTSRKRTAIAAAVPRDDCRLVTCRWRNAGPGVTPQTQGTPRTSLLPGV
jgi:hypothetical protein